MIIRNFYESQLSQASYLIGCPAAGEAIVIDPVRDVQRYVELAESLGLRIVAVTETHVHADFLSGSRELAAATGATIYLSKAGGPDWQYAYAGDPNVKLLQDGQRIRIGGFSLRTLHTPGHTPEHIAFLLTDHEVSELPHSLFSGDFVFVGDVGRPDLLERTALATGTMDAGARDLYRSLQKLKDLPDGLLIWPGHGAGSSCGKALGGSPASTLGYERATNWAFRAESEDAFVAEILSGQPEPPTYFREMKQRNQGGPALLGARGPVNAVKAPVGQAIDVRSGVEIRLAPHDGAVAVPYGKAFTGWAGWTVSYDRPITFIADTQDQADRAAKALESIGLDAVYGWTIPTPAPCLQQIDPSGIQGEDFVLDVREKKERLGGFIEGSANIPYGRLAPRIDEVPTDRRVVVYCAAGSRSLIAVSILRQAGLKNVVELAGGYAAVVEAEAVPQPA